MSEAPIADGAKMGNAPGLNAVKGVIQQPATFGSGESTQIEAGARITPGLIEDLGVMPLLGRTFASGEGRAGADDVAFFSEVVWRARFGSDPSIVGRRIDPLTWIVGVVSIALTTILTAWRPARQAMRVDPIALLRED